MISLKHSPKKIHYTTEDLARMFSVSKSWLEKNRCGAHQCEIPWHYWHGNKVRYSHKEVAEWLGEPILELYNTKELAAILSVSVSWLKHNRLGHDPIPSVQLGGAIRYHLSHVEKWMAKHRIN